MSTNEPQPDVDAALGMLKEFQRHTVDYVFERLYLDPDSKGRFLVADEAGLGKTMVARGVVAKAIRHLWETTPRIDIIYICSNADIANQNIDRLKIEGLNYFVPAKRITLLPISAQHHGGRSFKEEKVNFVPLTPGTSFKLGKQFGLVLERMLLYRLVERLLSLPLDGAMQVFSGDASKVRFRHRYLPEFDAWYQIDETLAQEFLNEFGRPGHADLRRELVELCQLFHLSRKETRKEHRGRHKRIISQLRKVLARTCMDALEPDLVILDEFQRFKHLLSDKNPAGRLAQALFQFPEVRILLLSATPYKMYTLSDESEEEDHYSDFLHTLSFLFDDPGATEEFRQMLKAYRQALLQYGNRGDGERDNQALLVAKRAAERRLRQVMARTEKLTASADRSGMFRDMPSEHARLQPQDLSAYVSLQRVAGILKQPNTLEYWKSAPYLLNFMEEYALKKQLKNAQTIEGRQQALARALSKSNHLLLNQSDVLAYQALDPGNARLRQLLADTVDAGAWKIMWVPPSLPYYLLGRPFAEENLPRFTKRLVFSAWHVVPKVVASLLSYEAERRMMRLFDETATNTSEERVKRRGLLRFTKTDGRLTGLPVLGIMYPCLVLAHDFDPLQYLAKNGGGDLPTADTLLDIVQAAIDMKLANLIGSGRETGPVDESWYWAAPILLDWFDSPKRTLEWWQTEYLATKWAGEKDRSDGSREESSSWSEHVAVVQELLDDDDPVSRFGRPPEDLAKILAKMALGGPGVLALRALSRVAGGQERLFEPYMRMHAASVAWAFRSLFNAPEVMALLRGFNQDEHVPYWQMLLDYAVAGCLQAVLDEYSHVLRESLGLMDKKSWQISQGVAEAMRTAIQLRTASLKVDDINVDIERESIELTDFRLRSHFALRFGDLQSDSDKTLARKGAVREAFNSPFWPFVLATTSVGQEGLDFHLYCHAIMHWNLPANPVDLEQREGRVHRYKGHAIRKNISRDFGSLIQEGDHPDPWYQLFELASMDASSSLVPYWIYPETGEAAAYIERYVPALPLSRDTQRLAALRRALTVYRMAFGQNRQEDLVEYLLNRLSQSEIDELMAELQINLQPRSSKVLESIL